MDFVTILNQLDERFRLADVFKIRGHHGVECLIHQHFNIAKALNHKRRLFIIDVHNHRQRQGGLKSVLGDQADFGQIFVKLMVTGLVANPF